MAYRVDYNGEDVELATLDAALDTARHAIANDVRRLDGWAVEHDDTINDWFVQAVLDGRRVGPTAVISGPDPVAGGPRPGRGGLENHPGRRGPADPDVAGPGPGRWGSRDPDAAGPGPGRWGSRDPDAAGPGPGRWSSRDPDAAGPGPGRWGSRDPDAPGERPSRAEPVADRGRRPEPAVLEEWERRVVFVGETPAEAFALAADWLNGRPDIASLGDVGWHHTADGHQLRLYFRG
nr:hypothetical protein [uncultured Actinoplanes sp.]